MVEIGTRHRDMRHPIDTSDDFSYPSAQVMANRESFDQTILEIGSTQSDHSGNQDYQQDEEVE